MRLRTLAHAAVALLPGPLKRTVYRRVFGFEVAADAQIGVSILDVDRMTIGPGARIGHGNIFTSTREVCLGSRAEVGFLNLIRGGTRVTLGPHSTVLRFNILNSIPDNDCEGAPDSTLIVGEGATIVSGHRLDFTDRITLGKNVIIAGRGSSLWTHNRQATSSIEIGDFCYLGSEVRLAPGARMGALCILGMGGVLAGTLPPRTVGGGVPAKPIRDVTDADERVLRKKTRRDIPEDLY